MRTRRFHRARWIFAFATAWVASLSTGHVQTEQQRPNDSTVIDEAMAPVRDLGADAEQDDPSSRLLWQRGAWGVVSTTFRSSAMREGRDHSDKKNARGPKWVSIGPTGAEYEQNGSFTGHVRDSGRARTVLPHPTNADIVYFLSSGGGLWRTNNWRSSNTTWTVLTDDLPTTGGGSAAFGRNPNTLYLGLGDPFDQILVGGSMTKSTNGGNTWSPIIELGTAVSVRDVQVDTSTNRDIVLVATDNGLYRSADDGDSYSAVTTFNGMSVWSIVRTSAGWLASAQPCPAASVGLRCAQPTTLFVSTNRGETWTPITNAGGVFSGGRTTLGVGVPGDAVVYAYSSNIVNPTTGVGDTEMKDVYRSTDGGQTWVANGVNATKIPTNPIAGSMPNMNICHAQCWYNQMILVDPRDPTRNTVWVGGDLGSAQTTNGGGTWTIKTWWLYNQVETIPYAHADFHAAAFKSTGTPTIILGNDGGMNISEDDGATFSSDKNNDLVTHLYYTVAGNPRLPSLVIGGTQDNGTRLRVGNGTIHNQVIGGDGMGAAYSQANTNTVIGSSQGSGMRTNLTNNPPEVFQNWVAATAGLSDVGFGFFTAVVPAPASLDPSGRIFFHFSNARVWRSDNGGLSWALIGSAVGVPSPGLPAARRFRSTSYNLGVSPTDLNRIAVGAAGGFLDITTNGGATWTDIDLIAKVPGYQGFISNVTWQDNQTMWLTAVAQAPGSARVIKATIANPADSWSTASYTVLQNGLPDLPVTRVYIDPRDATRATLYAATHVGVYRTVNGGVDWEPYSNGLPTVRVNDIYMPPDGGFMRIATYGRGIWELPQIELVSTTLADQATSCDRDGVLDNGEAGNLTITLKNQGANNINQVELTITSSNPAVTFPFGNTLSFPPLQKYGESTGSIRVALNGATGVTSADFNIAIVAPELELPSGLSVTATHRLNYDERLGVSTVESVEGLSTSWTVDGDPTTTPNINAWQRRALSPTRHVWWGPDNNGQADGQKDSLPDEQMLISPTMRVGTGPLVISFQHRFSFENDRWDAGVIELSVDGGSWTDIGVPAYNGLTRQDTSSPLGVSRPAFVNRMTGWPNFAPVSLNLGTAYAGKDIKIRFRIGADESTGAPGWEIDDISVSGITNLPFGALIANGNTCTTTAQ